MRHYLIALFLISNVITIKSQANFMETQHLSLTASCRDNPTCTYNGSDIEIDVIIKNISGQEIGFPSAYLARRGPTVQMIDQQTMFNRPQRINIAPYRLLKEFAVMKPGESIEIDTTIRCSEVLAFGGDVIDIIAAISPSVKIRVGDDDSMPFNDIVNIHITGSLHP